MDYNFCLNKWKFAKEAFEGSGGFANGGYIDKYPRESDDKYSERKKIAYYGNVFAPKINRYIGYLFKQTPTRTTQNQFIKKILDDVNNKGDNIDIFISNFAKNSKIRGVNLILIDAPKIEASNLKEQLENRLLPYFVEILPERVVDFKMDKFGKFEYVSFTDTINNSTLDKKEVQQIKRYYDKTKWIVFDENNKIIEQGEHNLGICPLLIFSENGEFPIIGEFTQIADLAKRHYNLQSETDEILRSQTFSILTIQADNPSNVEIKLSTDNAIAYQKEVERPQFIAPSSAPAEIYQAKIKEIEAQIDKIAYDISTNQSSESGIALDIKFQGLNASLSNFALRLNDLENRAFEVVCKYLNIQNDMIITYPKTFSIIDTQKEIATLQEMKGLVNSPTYFKLKALQIISNDLNTIDPADFATIAEEIEDSFKEV